MRYDNATFPDRYHGLDYRIGAISTAHRYGTLMIISRSDGSDYTFPHFRPGLGVRHKKLHTYEGVCDAVVGGDANPDKAFSGQNTHFQETSPPKEDRFSHSSTLPCIQQLEKCCPNMLYGGSKLRVQLYSGLIIKIFITSQQRKPGGYVDLSNIPYSMLFRTGRYFRTKSTVFGPAKLRRFFVRSRLFFISRK